MASERIGANTVLCLDLSDIRKEYAQKMEYLAPVHDGSTGEVHAGYWAACRATFRFTTARRWLCDITGAEANGSEIVPVYQNLYSAAAQDFTSENAEVLAGVDLVRPPRKLQMSQVKAPKSILSVLLLIRDARSTRNSHRILLWALALRCNPERQYLCFPSYGLLAKDTGLDVATCKRAARALAKAGLIRKVVRPNRSCVFFINVKLLMEQAAAVKAAEQAAKQEAMAAFQSPFANVEDADGETDAESAEEYDDQDDNWMPTEAR